MAAARTYNRALSGRSRPASRRDSGLGGGCGKPPGAGGAVAGSGGCAVPSPLRNNLSVATNLALEEAATGRGSVLSPRRLDTASQTLFERFGSFEGLTAALEDFHYRLCSDERVGATVQQVPKENVWLVMTQLMALLLQHHQQQELLHDNKYEDRQIWMRRCLTLLRPAGAAAAGSSDGGEGGLDQHGDAAVYDAVMMHLLATLERLGALGEEEDCALASRVDSADGSFVGLDDMPQPNAPASTAE